MHGGAGGGVGSGGGGAGGSGSGGGVPPPPPPPPPPSPPQPPPAIKLVAYALVGAPKSSVGSGSTQELVVLGEGTTTGGGVVVDLAVGLGFDLTAAFVGGGETSGAVVAADPF